MGILDYFIFGTVAIVFGYLLFKLWDRLESKKSTRVIKDPTWLAPEDGTPAEARAGAEAKTSFDHQEIYNFSDAFIGTLKGALAAPSSARLRRLRTVLAAPQTQDARLWQDMSMRLSQTAASYPVEFLALVETLAKHTDEGPLRGSAQHLARHTRAKDRKLGSVIGDMLPWNL
ncbi:hypothetical protein [Kordiimonas marina]|uniref:hypothetical protein n=1 Tax=Kordiimonas marina TaxID=2872312 RepID=UPI001FF1B356|nr:hypothetical protein [Kordiimonas marina]MCJ9430709.1 hypothetical protein [Kordiimonas marina]